MRGAAFAAFAAAAAIALAGCCTVWKTSDGGRDMCYVHTDGWSLLGLMPIVSGDPADPNRLSPLLFTDVALLDVNMTLLDDEMRKGGYSGVRNLSSYTTSEDVFFILLKRIAVHTSAELLK